MCGGSAPALPQTFSVNVKHKTDPERQLVTLECSAFCKGQ
jgi:hypothetical protein